MNTLIVTDELMKDAEKVLSLIEDRETAIENDEADETMMIEEELFGLAGHLASTIKKTANTKEV